MHQCIVVTIFYWPFEWLLLWFNESINKWGFKCPLVVLPLINPISGIHLHKAKIFPSLWDSRLYNSILYPPPLCVTCVKGNWFFTVAIKLICKLPGKIISIKTCEGALRNQIDILCAIWVMTLMEWLLVVESVF